MEVWIDEKDAQFTQILEKKRAMETDLSDLKVEVYRWVNASIDVKFKFKHRWTEGDRKRMIRDHKLGIPIPDLAKRYGRSPGAVRAMLLACGAWKRD